jgi:hypothetical protein
MWRENFVKHRNSKVDKMLRTINKYKQLNDWIKVIIFAAP